MLSILLLATSAFAQDTVPELNAQTLFLDNGGAWLRLRDVTPGPDRALGWQTTLSYTDRPLEYSDFFGNDVTVVGGLSQLDIAASYQLGRVRLGGVLPVQLHAGYARVVHVQHAFYVRIAGVVQGEPHPVA